MLEEHFSNKKLKYSATWQRLKRAFYSWDTVHLSHQNALFLQDTSRVCLNTEATQVAVLCNDAKLLCCLYFPFGYRLMVPCRADRQNKECNLRATLKWMELMNYVFFFLSASFITAIFLNHTCLYQLKLEIWSKLIELFYFLTVDFLIDSLFLQ